MLRPASEIRLRRSTCATGLRERGGERIADREVAQVADVQRLGRVRVPELDGEALRPCAEIGERRFGASARL